MVDYNWTCHVCENTVQAGNDVCSTCGSPSQLNADQITSRKNTWKSMMKSQSTKSYKCCKCNNSEFEYGQLRASGGSISAMLEVDNKRFTYISCSNCGYTEFYRHEVELSENIIDFLFS